MLTRFLRLLLILFLVAGIGWYFLYRNQQFLNSNRLTQFTDQLVKLPESISTHQDILGLETKNLDIKQLKNDQKVGGIDLGHSLQAFKTTQDFFKHVVKTNEKDQSNLTDRALKYGTYIYCKQVVNQWETATPSPQK